MKCLSNKVMYQTEALAEEALLDAWGRNNYSSKGRAPIAVYQCDDCGYYHFTSQGTMNARLKEQVDSGKIKQQQEANYWQGKFKL
ncbi:MAG TPA: hypothetical protein PKC24_15190 [Cyclobacteriaceae bacterium]|nr:hypothetical protein [Cyclobacteriaceae bacterium]